MKQPTSSSPLSRLISGCWRRESQPVDLSPDELERGLELAAAFGVSALLWRPDAVEPWRAALRDVARAASLRASRTVANHTAVEEKFNNAGIEHLFFKGRVAASNYAFPDLRAVGSDVDVLVAPDQDNEARELRKQPPYFNVDTKHPFRARSRVAWVELMAASTTMEIGGVRIPVLGPEHHLAAICENMLRHGGRTPSGILDIAACTEAHSTTMCWGLLDGEPLRRWVMTGIGLAHHLVGMRLEGVPYSERELRPPRWMVQWALEAWSHSSNAEVRQPVSLHAAGHTPAGLIAATRSRWPDPIFAVHELGMTGRSIPPLAAQTWYFVRSRRWFVPDPGAV